MAMHSCIIITSSDPSAEPSSESSEEPSSDPSSEPSAEPRLEVCIPGTMRLRLESLLTCSAVAVVGGYRYSNTHSTASYYVYAAFAFPTRNRPQNCPCSSRHRFHDHFIVSTSTCTFAELPRSSPSADAGMGRKRKAVRKAIANIQKKMASVKPRGVSSPDDSTRDEEAENKPNGSVQSTRNRVERGEDKWHDHAAEGVEYVCVIEAEATATLDALAIAKTAAADAFDAAESEIGHAEILLDESRRALGKAKAEAASALMTAELAAIEALGAARKATTTGIATAMADETKNNVIGTAKQIAEDDAMGLKYDDVGYHLSEMSPPFIDEDQCLVPGEALVRVEKAPGEYCCIKIIEPSILSPPTPPSLSYNYDSNFL